MRARDWVLLSTFVGGLALAALGGFGFVPFWIAVPAGVAAAVALGIASAP